MGANIPSDLHDDIPSLTRWSFREFKDAYDAIFGLKNEKRTAVEDVKECLQDKAPDESDTTLKKTKGGSAIYEQFLPQSDGGAQIQMPPLGEWKLKPLPSNFFGETKELAESITRDIVRGNPDVNWDSIKGLDSAKHLLKEAVVMPIKYPQYFKGLLSPWKGILLFGPPGTGKTMLAKAVATECNTTFFNISASSIVSKWRGDSEKLVRVLFQVARHYAPSTIFLDEIDSIISHRGEANSEHEASRRLKTELLIQMDGLMKTDDLVFLLAATNLPWELDAAMLRRLEKRILVPLPDADARRAMFEELLSTSAGDDLPYDSMVNDTEGYSGSDLRIVCKEAAMRPLRRLMKELEKKGNPAPTEDLPEVGPITKKDVMEALKLTKPSAHLQAVRYEKFNNDYGSQAMEE